MHPMLPCMLLSLGPCPRLSCTVPSHDQEGQAALILGQPAQYNPGALSDQRNCSWIAIENGTYKGALGSQHDALCYIRERRFCQVAGHQSTLLLLLGRTLEKCSGTGSSWSQASRMPLSQRARKCSQRTRSTHLHTHASFRAPVPEACCCFIPPACGVLPVGDDLHSWQQAH